ncbi:MAG: FtsX-like permease family protein [Saprospiraceae bacterium]
MLSNYFKVAWRALWQNKVYSIINLTGLTIGLTVVMLIMLYVQDDLSFDRFHANEQQLYRLVQDRLDTQGVVGKMGNTGFPQGPAFKAEVPEIQDFCRMKNGWNTLVKKGNECLEEKLFYVDNAFLSMFSFPVLAGNGQNALQTLESVVVTDRLAEKYFGKENPIGQLLQIGDEGGGTFKNFVVAAVVKRPPLNSSIQFDLLLSLEHIFAKDPDQRARDNSWHNANLNTFVLLQPHADAGQATQKMRQVTETQVAANDAANASVPGAKKPSTSISFGLQPLRQMHLDAAYYATNGLEYWSDAQYPKVLSALALLILLIACVNFVNLSLARSMRRSKEIGIRKATGGTRGQLFAQFMGESFLLTFLAFLPSLLLANALVPGFSKIMGKPLESAYLFQTQTLCLFCGLLLIVAFLTGFYPALVLSNFRPIESLKGQFRVARRSAVGVSLVVFQFVVAGMLIIGAIIATNQFHYIAHADLGYKTENILRFWLPWEQIGSIAPQLKRDLAQLPQVVQVSAKSGDRNSTKYDINGVATDWIYYEHIDENHLQLMGISLAQGRYLSYQFALDTVSNIVVNEAFVRQYLLPGQDPFAAPVRQRNAQMHIVGIVKDFHYASFKEKIRPMVWALDNAAQAGCIHVQIAEKNQEEALAAIKLAYKKYVPYLPMESYFLEDYRMQQYADDLRWKRVLDYATFFALFIAGLGLFGLTAFMTEQRTKEIGIRKVLGASVAGITGLLAKDFLKLVVIAIIIASPIAYYFMQKWLADFAYRIEMQWWMFVAAGATALAIAFLTVGFQSVKAALANPVKSLRSE